ncbi:hypothetical protein V498_01483 [Pseudogymnoascus sp. VKM F-4517 (FW-2822)]|nr:hypothetical protein V498_01483 [Pseudogymnoascus sp. VKM F-4517 (FW-2822)]
MSSNEDTEKRASFVSTSELRKAGGVCHFTLHPEYNLTRMSKSKSKSESQSESESESESESKTESKSESELDLQAKGQYPVSPPQLFARQGRAKSSRSSSREAPVQRRVTFTSETPTPQDDRLQGSPKSKIHLDRDNPGDWVIRHHRSSLVVHLKDHEVGKIRSTLSGMRKKLQGFKLGDEEAQKQTKSAASGDGKRFRVSFAEVQRMRIRKLQCQLVRHVVKMRLNGHESPGWEETLEQYSTLLRSSPFKALQDHDYMEKRSKSIRDPFLATGEYAIDNYVLNCNIDKILADDPSIRPASSLSPWELPKSQGPLQDYEPICGTRSGNITTTWYHGFKERVLLAAVGGAFLIGPMWLAVLQGGKYTGLITTTSFVASFGILMAYFLNEGKDVLGSTAAYAAVLVVFVGTSTQSPAGAKKAPELGVPVGMGTAASASSAEAIGSR